MGRSPLPSALTSLLTNATSIVRNNLCSRYGDIEMAAYGVVSAQLLSDGITFIIATRIYRKVYRSLQQEAPA